ncbi:hypothetical protein D3C73_904540 [compost metagenome]
MNEERLANDEYYYYFCDDLDSRDKINDVLQKYFSKNFVHDTISTYSMIEVNNRLAFLPYEIGSMLEWDQAEGILVKETDIVPVHC